MTDALLFWLMRIGGESGEIFLARTKFAINFPARGSLGTSPAPEAFVEKKSRGCCRKIGAEQQILILEFFVSFLALLFSAKNNCSFLLEALPRVLLAISMFCIRMKPGDVAPVRKFEKFRSIPQVQKPLNNQAKKKTE